MQHLYWISVSCTSYKALFTWKQYHAFRCSSKNLTMMLLDENDNFPVFDQHLQRRELQEGSKIGTVVATVSAADHDNLYKPSYRLAQVLTPEPVLFYTSFLVCWVCLSLNQLLHEDLSLCCQVPTTCLVSVFERERIWWNHEAVKCVTRCKEGWDASLLMNYLAR